MKKIATGIVAVIALMTMTACGSSDYVEDDPSQVDDGIYEKTVTLKNGDTLHCVVYSDDRYEQGGISCDWSTAK